MIRTCFACLLAASLWIYAYGRTVFIYHAMDVLYPWTHCRSSILNITHNEIGYVNTVSLRKWRQCRLSITFIFEKNTALYNDYIVFDKNAFNDINFKSIFIDDNDPIRFGSDFTFGDVFIQPGIIQITRSGLETLPNYLFKNTRSTKIDLSDNAICELPEELLDRNDTQLKHFDIARNKLQTVPSQLFKSQFLLETINISFNQLIVLPENLLADLESLTRLDLSNNQLKTLPGELFQNISKLQNIYLRNNLFVQICPALFANMPMVASHLTVHSQGNSIEGICDCLKQSRLTFIPALTWLPTTNCTDVLLESCPNETRGLSRCETKPLIRRSMNTLYINCREGRRWGPKGGLCTRDCNCGGVYRTAPCDINTGRCDNGCRVEHYAINDSNVCDRNCSSDFHCERLTACNRSGYCEKRCLRGYHGGFGAKCEEVWPFSATIFTQIYFFTVLIAIVGIVLVALCLFHGRIGEVYDAVDIHSYMDPGNAGPILRRNKQIKPSLDLYRHSALAKLYIWPKTPLNPPSI